MSGRWAAPHAVGETVGVDYGHAVWTRPACPLQSGRVRAPRLCFPHTGGERGALLLQSSNAVCSPKLCDSVTPLPVVPPRLTVTPLRNVQPHFLFMLFL